jgi:hypothetical protein
MTGSEIGSRDDSDSLTERPEYRSYLLRLWQADAPGEGPRSGGVAWHGSLESSLTGERQGFANLDELIEFLRNQTGMAVEVEGNQNQDDIAG